MENKIFDYPKICDAIKSLDEEIQFVSVINVDGSLGEVKGIIVIRSRVITMTFLLKDNILFVSADTSINYSMIFQIIIKEILGDVK